jgi:protein-S-isoprenylcysteine O-methyltransferase Ste14/prolipoprotein diacylglyceryltransferase
MDRARGREVVSRAGIANRIAYGALFVLVLPVALVLWARASATAISLPAVHSQTLGITLAILGLLLMAAGGRELITRGGGLPMNAFPPPRFVRSGIYRWIRNPMYIGFGLVCAGASISFGSASGLWLVTPVACLAAAALVHGFERHDLERRFGPAALTPPPLSLPRGNGEPPTIAQRIAVFLWVLIPWVTAYLAVQALGRPPDAFRTALPFERSWPVMQWTELLYASTYVFVPATALVIRTRRALGRFAVEGLVATVVVTLVWLTIPVVAANRPFEPSGWAGRLLAYEQTHSNAVAAFPAFHVLWALIAAEGWSANARVSNRSIWAWAGWSWALLISASSITTGMHTVVEVAAAVLAYVAVRRYDRLWERARDVTERIANSWKEWRVGPVRVINHGAWAAAAAGVGLVIAGSAAGPDHLSAVMVVAVCVLIGAGLWAQLLEGSSKLLRPFGWYGGVLGGVVGALAARLAGVPVVPVLAAFSIAAPWIQILGRLRCLVQGCCHGSPASSSVGIRYGHPRSRVTELADLAGVPIHATPLYSIAGNVVIGIVLVRLRVLGAPNGLIVGAFLTLGGLARFVEESYRGEPQTPVIAGLRSYQWLAVLSLLIGIAFTAMPPVPGPSGFSPPDARLVGAALLMAAVTGFAMGVDFPASNRRFSRLAAADPGGSNDPDA